MARLAEVLRRCLVCSWTARTDTGAGRALKGGGGPAAVFSGPLLGNRWSFGRMERGLLLLSCAPAETPDQFRLVCVSLGSDYSQYTCGSWQYSS